MLFVIEYIIYSKFIFTRLFGFILNYSLPVFCVTERPGISISSPLPPLKVFLSSFIAHDIYSNNLLTSNPLLFMVANESNVKHFLKKEKNMFHPHNFRSLFEEFVGNRFFTVSFVKSNGLERVMTCRLNVKKHCNGGLQSASFDKYLVGWEPAKKEYRNINMDTLKWVRCRGIEVDLAA